MIKLLERISVYSLGLALLAFGVVLNTKSSLGVSPVTLLPYYFTNVTGITIGIAIFLFNIVYFIMELLIMQKNRIKPLIILQIVFSLIFGWFTNLFSELILLNPQNLSAKLLTLAAAIFFTCLGVMCMIRMDIVATPPDSLVKEMAITFGKDYGLCKNLLDIMCVTLTLFLCVFVSHKIISIGIGTICCALMNGRVLYFMNKLLGPVFDKIISMKSE